MKSEEELFDDAFRKKLSDASERPPENFFDSIVPVKNKRRRILWWWISGVAILVTSAVSYELLRPDSETMIADPDPVSTRIHPVPGESSSSNQSHFSGETSMEHENGNAKTTLAGASLEEPAGQAGAEESSAIAAAPNHESAMRNRSNPAKQANSGNPIYSRKKEANQSPVYYYGNKTNNPTSQVQPYGNPWAVEQGAAEPDYFPVQLLPAKDANLGPIAPIQKPIMKPMVAAADPNEGTPHSIQVYADKLFPVFHDTYRNADSTAANLRKIYEDASVEINGWRAGVMWKYQFKKHWSVEAGFSYQQVNEKFSGMYRNWYQQLQVDTIFYLILFPFSPPLLTYNLDTTVIQKYNDIAIEHDVVFTTFHFDAGLRYSLPAGRFLIEPAVGISVALLNTVKGHSNYNIDMVRTEDNAIYDQKMNVSGKISLDIGYCLSEKVTLLVHAGYQAALFNQYQSAGFYDRTVQATYAGLGLRYQFFSNPGSK